MTPRRASFLDGDANCRSLWSRRRHRCVVVRGVPTAELEKTFTEMELSLDLTTEKCPSAGR